MSLLFGAHLLSFSGAELHKSAKSANFDWRPVRNLLLLNILGDSSPSCRNTYSSTASMYRAKNYTGTSTTTGSCARILDVSRWSWPKSDRPTITSMPVAIASRC